MWRRSTLDVMSLDLMSSNMRDNPVITMDYAADMNVFDASEQRSFLALLIFSFFQVEKYALLFMWFWGGLNLLRLLRTVGRHPLGLLLLVLLVIEKMKNRPSQFNSIYRIDYCHYFTTDTFHSSGLGFQIKFQPFFFLIQKASPKNVSFIKDELMLLKEVLLSSANIH